MNMKSLLICLLVLLIQGVQPGCASKRDMAIGNRIEPLPGADAVRLPGPSMPLGWVGSNSSCGST